MTADPLPCPFCGSVNTLPFEHDDGDDSVYGPEVAVYAGITLVSLLIGLLLVGALYFRILLAAAAVGALFFSKRIRNRRRPRPRGRFVCLACSRFFRG